MSALGARPAAAGHGVVRHARRRPVGAPRASRVLLRLATFTALAALRGRALGRPGGRRGRWAACSWWWPWRRGAPPRWRLLGRAPLPRRRRARRGHGRRALALLLAAMARGPVAAAAWPARLGELGDGLLPRARGDADAPTGPTRGPDEWMRLTILLGAPALLAAGRRTRVLPGRARRALSADGVPRAAAGALRDRRDRARPGRSAAARARAAGARGRVALAAAAGAARGLSAAGRGGRAWGCSRVPVAAAFDADRPWWNYRDWQWFGDGRAVTFDWTHSYGPLDWPRDGTTLLNIRSDRPHYWKVETLDGFDGFRWLRTPRQRARATSSRASAHALARGPALELLRVQPALGRAASGSRCARSRADLVGARDHLCGRGRGGRHQRGRRHDASAPTTIRWSAATPTPCAPTRPIPRPDRCAARPRRAPVAAPVHEPGAAGGGGERPRAEVDSPRGLVRSRARCRCRFAAPRASRARTRRPTPPCGTRRTAASTAWRSSSPPARRPPTTP